MAAATYMIKYGTNQGVIIPYIDMQVNQAVAARRTPQAARRTPHAAAVLMEKSLKDRHQWLGREFRGSLSLNMDKLFLKAIIHEIYH